MLLLFLKSSKGIIFLKSDFSQHVSACLPSLSGEYIGTSSISDFINLNEPKMYSLFSVEDMILGCPDEKAITP